MFYSAGICTLFLSALANAQYQMVKEYIGDNFFDNWNFYNNSKFGSTLSEDFRY